VRFSKNGAPIVGGFSAWIAADVKKRHAILRGCCSVRAEPFLAIECRETTPESSRARVVLRSQSRRAPAGWVHWPDSARGDGSLAEPKSGRGEATARSAGPPAENAEAPANSEKAPPPAWGLSAEGSAPHPRPH